jgi:hypothetical protein
MSKHFVVIETDTSRNPVGSWLVIATPDDFEPTNEPGFPEESLQKPVGSFSSQAEAMAERDRLDESK